MKGKNEKTVLEFSITAVKAAATNAAKIQDIALEVPTVDARDLSIDEQIFGIELLPIKKEKNGPDNAKYVAVKPVVIEVLSGRNKPGFITVNGTIDMPKEAGRVVKLEDSFFADLDTAKAVCRVITEVELERALEREKEEHANVDFYLKQQTDDRY
jgi:hypothetical protein